MEPLQLADCLLLITDDDMINRVVLKHMLKDCGMQMEEATDGSECLELIQKSKAKRIVLLLDLNMPIMDGYEVIEHMKNDPAKFDHVRTLVISASLQSQFAKSGLSEYIMDYIEKPVDKERLLIKVIECTI